MSRSVAISEIKSELSVTHTSSCSLLKRLRPTLSFSFFARDARVEIFAYNCKVVLVHNRTPDFSNMCGILSIFGSSLPDLELRKKLIECSQRLRHRGPDWSGYLVEPGTGIGHERLAIIDPESGAQPLYSADKQIVVAANGEVYNYKDLYASLATPYTPLTGSDCEVRSCCAVCCATGTRRRQSSFCHPSCCAA